MRATIIIMTICLGIIPASAVQITLLNNSSQVVDGLNVFPVDTDGDPVEDNLGGFYDPVAPLGRAQADLDGNCGNSLFVVMMGDGSELRAQVDTCTQNNIEVSD